MALQVEKNHEFIYTTEDGKNAFIFGYGDKITLSEGKVIALIDGTPYKIVEHDHGIILKECQ